MNTSDIGTGGRVFPSPRSSVRVPEPSYGPPSGGGRAPDYRNNNDRGCGIRSTSATPAATDEGEG